MCALVFLALNGRSLEADPEALYELVDGIAAGSVDKAEVAVFLRRNAGAEARNRPYAGPRRRGGGVAERRLVGLCCCHSTGPKRGRMR
jgi:hypothetical protein